MAEAIAHIASSSCSAAASVAASFYVSLSKNAASLVSKVLSDLSQQLSGCPGFQDVVSFAEQHPELSSQIGSNFAEVNNGHGVGKVTTRLFSPGMRGLFTCMAIPSDSAAPQDVTARSSCALAALSQELQSSSVAVSIVNATCTSATTAGEVAAIAVATASTTQSTASPDAIAAVVSQGASISSTLLQCFTALSTANRKQAVEAVAKALQATSSTQQRALAASIAEVLAQVATADTCSDYSTVLQIFKSSLSHSAYSVLQAALPLELPCTVS